MRAAVSLPGRHSSIGFWIRDAVAVICFGSAFAGALSVGPEAIQWGLEVWPYSLNMPTWGP